MAYLDREQKKIVLSTEDEEMFRESAIYNSTKTENRRMKTSEHIMHWIMTGKRKEENI